MGRPPPAVVVGAPGSGKSTVVERIRGIGGAVILDIDAIIDSASELAGKDVHFAEETWPPYNALWSDVLHAIARNGLLPVLFAPDRFDPTPDWCATQHILLLHCPDDARRARLAARGWDEGRIAEALEDAAELLAGDNDQVIDTAALTPDEVEAAVSAWISGLVAEA